MSRAEEPRSRAKPELARCEVSAARLPGAPRSVGIIGCGLIARPVIRELVRGQLDGWKLDAVLARSPRHVEGVDVLAAADQFFAHSFDLIIDAAGPEALRSHGRVALTAAELWSVSGTALANETLRLDLESVGAKHGHRLRLLPGAISGLDGVSTMSIAHDGRVSATIDLVPSGDTTEVVFVGSAAEAADLFPHHVNVVVATALAGVGLERTEVTVRQPAAGRPHTLSIEAISRDGSVTATTQPVVSRSDGVHIVAASLIAALRRESQVIWVG